MLKEIMKKQVVVSMSNGYMFDGFVDEFEEDFIKVVDLDNNKLIVRKDDISFVRIKTEEKPFKDKGKDCDGSCNKKDGGKTEPKYIIVKPNLNNQQDQEVKTKNEEYSMNHYPRPTYCPSINNDHLRK